MLHKKYEFMYGLLMILRIIFLLLLSINLSKLSMASLACPDDSKECIEKFWSSDENIEFLKYVNELANQSLPIKYNSNVTLVRSTLDIESRTITYEYQVNKSFKIIDTIKNSSICEPRDGPIFLFPDLNIKILSKDKKGNVTEERVFTIKDCLKQ